MDIYQKLILDIIELNTKQKQTIEDLKAIKRDFAKVNKLSDIPTNIKLIRAYQQLVQSDKINKSIEIENLLKKRAIRSQSGIVAVQVLTKPYMCPGKCIFCPNEKGMPKSYISTEPGAMRAALNQFDPIKQTYNRLLSLTMTGHQTDKIEMIVLGGTRDVYPKDYKIEFIKSLYDACNTFSKLKFDPPEDPPLSPLQGGKDIPKKNKIGKSRKLKLTEDVIKEKGLMRDGQSFPYNSDNIEKANYLRKNMTIAEKKLRYDLLSKYEYKFYRQRPIDHFIADFYCSKLDLVIEIDGGVHDQQRDYDKMRTELLNMYGLTVIRFSNDEVLNNFDDVCKKIKDYSNKIITNQNTRVKVAYPERGGGPFAVEGSKNKQKQNSRYSYDITNLNTIKYSSSLPEAIKINETADNRIIGLTIETRPEYMTDANCQLWREMGVTRLEMGVQSMYDDVLDANKRGHSVQTIRNAIHKMRQYGFKFSIHIMPGLYKSNYDKDLGTFEQIYNDPFIKPDEIKFYPTSVIPNTELYNLYKAGDYQPLTTDTIQKLIKQTFQEIIPPYTRIKRLIRDIPATEIAAGSNVTNLSQLTHNSLRKEFKLDNTKAQKLYSRLYGDYKLFNSVEDFISNCHCEFTQHPVWIAGKQSINTESANTGLLHSSPQPRRDTAQGQDIKTYIIGQDPDISNYRDFVSLDTRSREIRNKSPLDKGGNKRGDLSQKPNLIIRQYSSSVGTEYFISFEDLEGYLYGFTRLLLPQKGNTVDREGLGPDTALIRELHIYGQVASLKGDSKSKSKKQHKGFGTQLMNLAEELSKTSGFKRLSVISGVGVRGYYEKIGYTLDGTYMVKKI